MTATNGSKGRGVLGTVFLIVLLDIVGFSILFPLFPALLDLEAYDFAPAHTALTAHLEELEIGVVDLTPDLRAAAQRAGGPGVLRTNEQDAIHPSPLAYRVAAHAVERWLAAHRPWAEAR